MLRSEPRFFALGTGGFVLSRKGSHCLSLSIHEKDSLERLFCSLYTLISYCAYSNFLLPSPGFFSHEPGLCPCTVLSLLIRWYLSGGGLLAIVHKRFMIRQFEDGFESQPGAPR